MQSPLGGIARGAMPPHQRFGNWLSASLMRLLYSVPVTDLGPFRAIRADLLQELDMREMTYGWPSEMIVKAASQDHAIALKLLKLFIRIRGAYGKTNRIVTNAKGFGIY